MKKIISLTTALVLCMGTVSCGKKSSESKKKSSAVTAPLLSYKSADIDMAESFSSIIDLDRDAKSGDILIFGQLESGIWSGYATNADFSDYSEFRFIPEENENVLGAAMSGFGKKAVLTCMDGVTYIHIFGSDGSEEKRIDCGEIFTGEENEVINGRILRNGDGFVINDNNQTFYSVDSQGNTAEIDAKGMTVMGISGTSEGGVTVLLQDPEFNSFIAEIEGSSLGSRHECGSMSSSALAMCPSDEENGYTAVLIDGLYKLIDNEWVKLSDFMDLDFTATDIMRIIMTGENEFAILRWEGSGMTLNLLTERDISELKSKKVIRVGTLMSSPDTCMVDMAKKFNAENDEYRVELIAYGKSSLTMEETEKDLKLEILKGNTPDIITNNISGIDPTDYYFDLYEFIDKDPELNREDFIPGLLEGTELDGKLTMISPSFSFSTMTAKSKFPFVKENWSYEDLISAYSELPEGMELSYSLKNVFLWESLTALVTMSDFVDFQTAECSFDSPEFISMLNFVKDAHLGKDQEEAEQWSLEDQEFRSPMDFRNDKQLFGTNIFFNMYHVWEEVKGRFGEDVTFMGRPSVNGKGSWIQYSNVLFSIFRNCEYPEGAWEFIKYFFTDYYYNESDGSHYFPVIEKNFDENAKQYLTNETFTNEETGKPDADYKWYTSNENFDEYIILEPLTQEELDRYSDFIKASASNYRRYDSTLMEIINEELNRFFNSDSSAEDTAAMIQSRASIYLSETYD